MSKRKLLLADDSITIQKVVNLTFADEGIEVITAGDGNTAMERFSEYAPDLVLADVNMPGLNGYEICEIIRQNEETKNTPVILLVGSFEPFDEDEARRVGANDFLTKPFQSIRQLVTKVTELIGTNGASEELPQEAESIGLETQSREPENEDIDSLYKESFADTVEMPGPPQESEKFTDPGMDDEMIETSFGDKPAEEEPFPPLDEPAFLAEAPESHQEPHPSVEENDFPDEQPESVHSHETPFSETETDFTSQFEERPSSFEEEQQEETFFDAVSDTEQTEYHEEPVFEEQTPWNSVAEPVQQSESSESVEPAEPARTRFEFDDLNLLELPSRGTSTASAAAPAPAPEIIAPASVETGEISPEVIDHIAVKVAELVIRELEVRIPAIVDAAVARKIHEETNR